MNLTLSPEAASRLHSAIRDDGEGRVLRIAFTTGCGGSGYRLSYASEPTEDDEVMSVDGVTIALDTMASSRLDGAVIRFDTEEDGFLIDHPDAVTSAWCG